MKKFTLLFSFVLLSLFATFAQTTKSDSLLLSKEQQKDKIVEKYLVRGSVEDSAEYEALFPINLSTLQSSFADNEDSMAELHRFIEQAADTMMHIKAIKVVGHASPDGVPAKNALLAAARATSVKNYLTKQCPKMNIESSSVAYKWADCVDAVKKSSLDKRDAVISILNSKTHTEEQKQSELEKHPEVWQYFKINILPAMRCAEIHFNYVTDRVVEKVTIITPPAPTPKPQPKPTSVAEHKSEEKLYPVAVVENVETGIIVEVPQKEHKHRRDRTKKR